MTRAGLRKHSFTVLVLAMLVAAEIAVVGGSGEGPAAVRYLFPLLWTLPLPKAGVSPPARSQAFRGDRSTPDGRPVRAASCPG